MPPEEKKIGNNPFRDCTSISMPVDDPSNTNLSNQIITEISNKLLAKESANLFDLQNPNILSEKSSLTPANPFQESQNLISKVILKHSQQSSSFGRLVPTPAVNLNQNLNLNLKEGDSEMMRMSSDNTESEM